MVLLPHTNAIAAVSGSRESRPVARAALLQAPRPAPLAESPWVGGPAYSVADITALVAVDFAGWLKLELPPECVHARAWHADASRRPSALA